MSSRHTPHFAPLSSLSRLAPPLFAVAICPCARRVSLVLGPRAFALGLWCLHPRFVPSFRFVACLRVLALFGAFGLCFHLGSRSPASIRGSFSFSACAFVGASWGLVTCFRCSAGRGPLPSAFAFVFGFWLRSRLLASFSALPSLSAFAFVFDSCFCCPSACLRYSCPLRVFPRFRLVPLLSAYAFAACAFDLGLCLRFYVLVFFRLLSSTFSLDPVFVRHLRFSGLWPRFNIFVSSALDILFYLFFAGYCILRPTVVIIWVPVFLIFIFFTSTCYYNPVSCSVGSQSLVQYFGVHVLLVLTSIIRPLRWPCI